MKLREKWLAAHPFPPQDLDTDIKRSTSLISLNSSSHGHADTHHSISPSNAIHHGSNSLESTAFSPPKGNEIQGEMVIRYSSFSLADSVDLLNVISDFVFTESIRRYLTKLSIMFGSHDILPNPTIDHKLYTHRNLSALDSLLTN